MVMFAGATLSKLIEGPGKFEQAPFDWLRLNSDRCQVLVLFHFQPLRWLQTDILEYLVGMMSWR